MVRSDYRAGTLSEEAISKLPSEADVVIGISANHSKNKATCPHCGQRMPTSRYRVVEYGIRRQKKSTGAYYANEPGTPVYYVKKVLSKHNSYPDAYGEAVRIAKERGLNYGYASQGMSVQTRELYMETTVADLIGK